MFSALGVFSPGLPADSDLKIVDPKAIQLIWMACGDQDNTVHYERVKAWAESVQPKGVKASFHTYAGAHTWPVWRMSLADFVPLLFVE